MKELIRTEEENNKNLDNLMGLDYTLDYEDDGWDDYTIDYEDDYEDDGWDD